MSAVQIKKWYWAVLICPFPVIASIDPSLENIGAAWSVLIGSSITYVLIR